MVRSYPLIWLAAAASLVSLPAEASTWTLVGASGEGYPGASGAVFFESRPVPCPFGVAAFALDTAAITSGEVNSIYLLQAGRPPELVISPATDTPGIGRLRRIGGPACSGERIAFVGESRDTGEQGAFEWRTGVVAHLLRLDELPAAEGTFRGFSNLDLEGDDVAFLAGRIPAGGGAAVSGAWVRRAGNLKKLMEVGSVPDGSSFPVLGLSSPDFGGGNVTLRAIGPFPFVGVYTESESGLRVLLDNSGEIEGSAGWNWTDIGAFSASAGRVLFVATQTDGTSFRRGLFLWTGEDFEELAFLGAGSAERPVPAGFANVFLDGDRLGFIGTQPPGTGDLYLGTTERWRVALRVGEQLDGRVVSSIVPNLGHGRVAALVDFTDGSQGIYLYQGSPLEIPTLGTWALAVFAVALMALGAGLLRR
jgi:hypothetical protein